MNKYLKYLMLVFVVVCLCACGKKEVEKPTITNLMRFSPNNSFKRLSNIDYHKNYDTFKYHFQTKEDWEKNFSNLYSYWICKQKVQYKLSYIFVNII